MKKDFEENAKEEEMYTSEGMKGIMSRPPPTYSQRETKENIMSQPYTKTSPFATDYPEKPKTFQKQSTFSRDVEMTPIELEIM